MTTKSVLVCDQCGHSLDDSGTLPPGWLSLVHVDNAGTPQQLHFEDWHCLEEYSADQRIAAYKAKQAAEQQAHLSEAQALEALHREWDDLQERQYSLRGQITELGGIDPVTGEHQATKAAVEG